MTRRTLLQALVLSLLAGTLSCALVPGSALAQPGKGYEKSQGKGQGKGQAQHSQGRSDDRGYPSNNTYNRSQGENSGRGRSDDQRQPQEGKHNKNQQAQQHPSLSPQKAAQQARSQYGGQVLKVQPAGSGYQVRLLQDDGRVVTVSIGD